MKENPLIEKGIDSRTVYSGTFFDLKCDRVLLSDGSVAVREYIGHPGAVMIIPLFDDGRVLMERQYRYPIGRIMLEFPAGKLDRHESAKACAQRELQEETGYSARELIPLTRIHPVAAYSTETLELYLARGLIAGERRLDTGEFIETVILSPTELFEQVKTGQISDAKTIIGAFWLQGRFDVYAEATRSRSIQR